MTVGLNFAPPPPPSAKGASSKRKGKSIGTLREKFIRLRLVEKIMTVSTLCDFIDEIIFFWCEVSK